MTKHKKVKKDPTDALIERLNTEMAGHVRIMRASEYQTAFHIRRPTGITSIDAGLKGGWPAGALSQIFGAEGLGKDYLINCTVREVQRKYGENSRIFLASFGYPVHDLQFAEICGVDRRMGQLLLIGPDKPEQSRQILRPAETLLSTCIELVASGRFQLGVLNEVGAELTQDRAKKELGESTTASTARLMTQFTQRFSHYIGRPLDSKGTPNATTMLLVLQVRANLDPYGAHLLMPAGRAVRHAKACDIHLHAAGQLKDADDAMIGRQIRWTLQKGKLGTHDGPSGTYNYHYIGGADLIEDLIDTAMLYKSVVLVDSDEGASQGSKAKHLHAPRFEGSRWKTRTQLKEALHKDEDLFDLLRTDTLRRAGVEEETV